MYNKREIGGNKEAQAAKYLLQEHYSIIECNYFCRAGEIDIVAQDGEYLVFVEVKYRKNTKVGYPEEAINRNKIQALVKTARNYLYRHGMSFEIPCRFDVIVILDEEIKLYKNAFDLNDAY